jgi:HAMP domain.
MMIGTERIARGDFGRPIVTDKMVYEIKELGKSFNSMMLSLSESEEKTASFLET